MSATCVLDTDVVIAAIDRADPHHERAASGILDLIAAEATLMISAVNYAETLVRPARDERTVRSAIDAIGALGIEPVAATGATAREAARLRGRGISLPDGFALASPGNALRPARHSTLGCCARWARSASSRPPLWRRAIAAVGLVNRPTRVTLSA